MAKVRSCSYLWSSLIDSLCLISRNCSFRMCFSMRLFKYIRLVSDKLLYLIFYKYFYTVYFIECSSLTFKFINLFFQSVYMLLIDIRLLLILLYQISKIVSFLSFKAIDPLQIILIFVYSISVHFYFP